MYYLPGVTLKYSVVFRQQKSTYWYVQSQRGLKNHFFDMHYLTTNEPLDVL